MLLTSSIFFIKCCAFATFLLRETFAICSLSESHNVEYGKSQGDFRVDGKYTFEIGGRSKDYSQIAGLKDSFIFADDWDIPDGAKLPLWMLGFLY